jgi:hypothetical protein
MEVRFQVPMGLLRGFLYGGFFEGAIQPFDPAVRPRMIPLGQMLLDTV